MDGDGEFDIASLLGFFYIANRIYRWRISSNQDNQSSKARPNDSLGNSIKPLHCHAGTF